MAQSRMKWMLIETLTLCNTILAAAMLKSVLLRTRSPTVIGPMLTVPRSIDWRFACWTFSAGTLTCTASPSKLEVQSSRLGSRSPPGGECVVRAAHRGAQIRVVALQHVDHRRVLDPLHADRRVHLRRVILAEVAIAFQPPRSHQDEDAEGGVAEAEPGWFGLGEHADHQVQTGDAAFVNITHLARPARVVRHFVEARDRPQMHQAAEQRIAWHAKLTHTHDVDGAQVDDLAIRSGEVLQEPGIVVQLQGPRKERAERVQQVLHRCPLEELVAFLVGDVVEGPLLDELIVGSAAK